MKQITASVETYRSFGSLVKLELIWLLVIHLGYQLVGQAAMRRLERECNNIVHTAQFIQRIFTFRQHFRCDYENQ